MRGTHRGPYRSRALQRTLAPTGRRVEVPAIGIHRLAGGRIVESLGLNIDDSVALLLQLGILPVDAPAPPG